MLSMNRRQVVGAGLAALAAGIMPRRAQARVPGPGARRVLRLAHITDCHVQAGPGESGMARAFAHLQGQADAPTLIINTGDTIMDSSARTGAATDAQWALWQKIVQAECDLPIYSCLGNHDLWGTNKQASQTTGNENLWGWRRGVAGLRLDAPYYSFNRGGWHFVALNDTHIEGGYSARLDDEQYAWLAADLAAQPADRPVLVFSHHPIISVSGYFDGDRLDGGTWTVPGTWMHADAVRLKDLFHEAGNVRLCLSGHMHQVDYAEFLGTAYFCGGAVSANWWNEDLPNYYECHRGYGLVDLYDDGSHQVKYIEYDRDHRPA